MAGYLYLHTMTYSEFKLIVFKEPSTLRSGLLSFVDKVFLSYVSDALKFGATIKSFPPHYTVLCAEDLGQNRIKFSLNSVKVVDPNVRDESDFFTVGLSIKEDMTAPDVFGVFVFLYGEAASSDAPNEKTKMIFVYLFVDDVITAIAGYPIENNSLDPMIDLPHDFVPPQINELLAGLTAERH